jgi:hypothetical protein
MTATALFDSPLPSAASAPVGTEKTAMLSNTKPNKPTQKRLSSVRDCFTTRLLCWPHTDELTIDGLLEHNVLDYVLLEDSEFLSPAPGSACRRVATKPRANYIGAHAVLGPFLPSHHALPHPVEISPADLAERQQRIGIEALGQRLLC